MAAGQSVTGLAITPVRFTVVEGTDVNIQNDVIVRN